MRRILAATLVAGGLVAFVAAAALTTLRAEARGPLGVSGSALLDVGSLQLRVALVSAGGTVATILPDGVIVQDRRRRLLRIYFEPHAQFLQDGLAVSPAVIEPGAHLTVLGLRGANGFSAYKVRISPHHHAIGGLIVLKLADLFTVVSHRGVVRLVRMRPGAALSLRGRPTRMRLHPGLHVLALAVPDPRQPGLFLADAVHVLLRPTSFRGGGIITRLDVARNLITLYNKTLNLMYTVEVKSTTRITLSRWTAGYADMRLGDHLTISGVTDPANASIGPNPIVARRIRISSLNFGGVITAIEAAARGAAVLIVRARRGHILQIDAPGRAAVSYGAQSAHVPDLLVGERIAARGRRVGKFELVASFIHIYPHQHTVGGTVAAVLPGLYRIVNPADGSEYIIHVTSRTSYTLGGRTATAAVVTVGQHIRAHGYDALHADQKSIPTLIATHITVLVHHPRQTKRTVHTRPKRKAAPTVVPSILATPAATATIGHMATAVSGARSAVSHRLRSA